MDRNFKVGDIVCHAAAWLRSVSWFTDVPDKGTVTKVGPNPHLVSVQWPDLDKPTRLHRNNIVLHDQRHLEPR